MRRLYYIDQIYSNRFDFYTKKFNLYTPSRAHPPLNYSLNPRGCEPKTNMRACGMSILIFPGQGSRSSLIDRDNPIVQHFTNRAEKILGYNLLELTPEDLADNKYSQVDLFVRSAILANMHEANNQKISFVAGHSLGQYAACFAAGGLSFEDGLNLVQNRAKFMSEAIKNHPGAMVACVGAGVTDLIREMVAEFSKLYLANYNSSQQIVVSGDAQQIDELIILAKEKRVRCVKLGVSGAFHSPFMSTANELMNPLIGQANFQDTETGFISNKSGKILRSKTEFQDEFEDQIILPVHWSNISQTIAALVEQEDLEVYEMGHGNTLGKLLQQETGIIAKSTM